MRTKFKNKEEKTKLNNKIKEKKKKSWQKTSLKRYKKFTSDQSKEMDLIK